MNNLPKTAEWPGVEPVRCKPTNSNSLFVVGLAKQYYYMHKYMLEKSLIKTLLCTQHKYMKQQKGFLREISSKYQWNL